MSSSTIGHSSVRFRQDLLYRLRWNVFDDVSVIEVVEGLNDDGTEQRKLLHSHPIATESLADPPIYKMSIDSLDLSDAVTFMFAPKESAQSHSIIRSPEDGPITIFEFVREVHIYLNQSEDAIRAYRTPFLRTGIEDWSIETDKHPDFFFDSARANIVGDEASVSIRTFAVGEIMCSAEKWCARQRKHAAGLYAMRERLATKPPTYPPGTAFDIINQKLLYRLRWNILGILEDIEVEDGLNEDGTERRQPFLLDPIAAERLAKQPLRHAKLTASDVQMAQVSAVAPDGYHYSPLILDDSVGHPFTVQDFVECVHVHLKEHRDVISNYRKCAVPKDFSAVDAESNSPSTQPKLFFDAVVVTLRDGGLEIGIICFLEGEFGTTADAFYERQRKRAANGMYA
jgi:hypothetical protein